MARRLDDEDWEQSAEEILAESTHSTELGKQMGRDAVRVSIGEMSEADFHEKYHDVVLEEFGVDDRPTKPEGFDE
ncbi:4Fe-4S ferredoxin N-terminal domain-containing protein [Halorhabdus rudnickae]|uniref:4Fe-4S ferredoxin N-terminal domain-containing protein n=1 Tax=Halorhabdus rudnickae TaxID=1775544 RepID=UPI0010841BA3|nr:4Fe-4S ferredoxin N-terminal domain-containing protein [Halorhabdus rudnickae]